MYRLTIYRNFDSKQPLPTIRADTRDGIRAKLVSAVANIKDPTAECDGWTIGDPTVIGRYADEADAMWYRATVAYVESYGDWELTMQVGQEYDFADVTTDTEHGLTFEECMNKFIDACVEWAELPHTSVSTQKE